jgi:hypothetical protein
MNVCWVLLDLWVHGLCCRVAFDCAPQVRPVLRFEAIMTTFPRQSLMDNRQHRHLEQEQACHSNHDWRVGGQRWVPHSK